jgi:hypothetical protein
MRAQIERKRSIVLLAKNGYKKPKTVESLETDLKKFSTKLEDIVDQIYAVLS